MIGPIVALSDADAVALCGPLMTPHRGRFLRVDTREPEGEFRRFLSVSGIVEHDTVQRMSLETLPEPAGPQRTYGLVSQALT
ncbi:hypothetical protein PY32053_01122 [Paracoccus yeei]|uniref:YitH/HolE acetyltransferase (GNAT) domain-containing protein n=1 Tax=Paracoccus yeei TaxID=147645 RepID=A0A386UKV7_9RHOB|nr:hypothetical protein PY32053_01122 [Paracoccus yeei]